MRRASIHDNFISMGLRAVVRKVFDLVPGRTYHFYFDEDGKTIIATGTVKPGNNRVYLNGGGYISGFAYADHNIDVGSPGRAELYHAEWMAGS